METQKEPFDNSDLSVQLEQFVEVLTTDDERLTIIGEELSNETGRAVIAKLFDGVTSVSEIAASLNISIPLVSWHIQRLSKVHLINVTQIKLSKKNKKIFHYSPSKFALVIVPSNVVKSTIYSDLLKSSLKKIYKKISVIAVFVVSTASLYLLKTSFVQESYSFVIRPLGGEIELFLSNPDFIISVAGGAVIAFATWLIFKFKKRQKS